MTTSIAILILIGPVIIFWVFAGFWLMKYIREEEKPVRDFTLWEAELKEFIHGPE